MNKTLPDLCCILKSTVFLLIVIVGVCLSGLSHAQLLTGFETETTEKTIQSTDKKPEIGSKRELNPPSAPIPAAQKQMTELLKGGELLQPIRTDENASPVDLQADSLIHDDKSKVIKASGNVVMVQDGRILRADEISYDVKADRIVASGYVVINETNGDIHTFDTVELTQGMKNGFVKGLKTFLADGSRFTALNGERKKASTTVMSTASYTPCEPCKTNPDDVVWQIKASEVTYHEEEHRVSYNNAWFELLGIPVAYTPYFSHSDGSINQKSGFLAPSFSLDSELGVGIGTSYYWAVAPDVDITTGLIAFTEENPLLTGEWRQRWNEASLSLNGGITYSQRIDSEEGVNFTQDNEVRGHIFGDILWDMNDEWRSGANIEYASDDQYLRQYDFSSDDVLENELYAERFSGRNYAAVRLIDFQDVRIREEQVAQPSLLPEFEAGFIGDPGDIPLIGGRWDIKTSVLGLYREGKQQDVARYSLEGGWKRRFISDTGLLTSFDARGRGDIYHTQDGDDQISPSGEDQITETRFFPQMNIQSSYPLAKEHERFQSVIEPIVSLTAAPNIDVSDNIANEDSQDVQIDTSNLFEPNRFPGLDRVEDQSRLTYGLRTGLHGYDGSAVTVFLGQSRRFDKDDNPFPEGSGLNSEESDYVGEINADYKDLMQLSYRLQLANDNLSSERHEIDYMLSDDKFSFNTRYLYAAGLEGTDINESREQIEADIGYFVTPQWRTSIGATQDLGFDPGLRKSYLGLDYYGQCLSWGLTAERNLTDDSSGDSGTEVLLRIGLKNIGEFKASGIEFKNSDNESDQ